MRKLAICLLVVAVAIPLLAQAIHEHQNATERKARDQITLLNDVLVGKQTLPAGKYEIACDRTKMTFSRVSDGKKMLEVICHGKELSAKVQTTEVYVSKNAAGASYIDKLLLRGSNVEHVFTE